MIKPRGRPKKHRTIQQCPKIIRFSPRGRPGRPDEIEIKMDEFEAIRLTDCLGLKQSEAARSMQVSQQTFSMIIREARRTLSDAFINGKMIRINASKERI